MPDLATLAAEVDALPSGARERLPEEELAGRTIFLSGATGFVGSWLLAAVASMNARLTEPVRVRALTRSPRPPGPDWLEWEVGDVRSYRGAGRADYVVHAAFPSSAFAPAAARELLAVAVDGTRAVLAHAVTAGATRALLLSSGAVYGPGATAPLAEDSFRGWDPLDPTTFYGETKRVTELCGAAFAAESGLDVGVARLFSCLGPGYRDHGHLAHVSLLADALAGRAVRIRGTGQAVRSYLYGADLAVWLLRILVSGPRRAAFNVGSDRAMTVLDLAKLALGVAGRGAEEPVIEGDPSEADSRSVYVPDVGRARRVLGLDVWTSAEEGLARTARLTEQPAGP